VKSDEPRYSLLFIDVKRSEMLEAEAQAKISASKPDSRHRGLNVSVINHFFTSSVCWLNCSVIELQPRVQCPLARALD